MQNHIISKRYAKALIMSCGDKEETAKIALDQIAQLDSLFDDSKLQRTLLNPTVPKDTKKTIFTMACDQINAGTVVKAFVATLLDEGRINLFSDIKRCLQSLIDEKAGICTGKIITAVKVSESQLIEISSSIEKKLNLKLRLEHAVDSEILGGFVVHLGHRTIDMSLKHKLNRFVSSVTNAAS